MLTSKTKLRILALHGYTQSDTIFKGKLGSLRKSFKSNIEFVFVTAPHKVPIISNNTNEDTNTENAASFEEIPKTNGYGWWFNTEDYIFKATVPSNISVGFEDSVALIKKTLQESGPFDGILGFSQGAAFATILCAMQEMKLIPIMFNFAIIISGFKSLCAPHGMYYNVKINIPSLHIYGSTDQVIPTSMAQEVSNLFLNKKEVIHEGGHYIPSKKDTYRNFIMDMLEHKISREND